MSAPGAVPTSKPLASSLYNPIPVRIIHGESYLNQKKTSSRFMPNWQTQLIIPTSKMKLQSSLPNLIDWIIIIRFGF
jgi:hypothetical protein